MTVKKVMTESQISDLEKRTNARWRPDNLIPCVSERYPADISYEYELKYLCWDAAEGNPRLYKDMYHKWTLAEVYEAIMLRRVYNWWS